jgi:SAM-dependent methyltransferase
MKSYIKAFIYKLGLSPILDYLLYLTNYFLKFKKNRNFKSNNPSLNLPPSYYLYETYNLDYKLYIEDGELAAKEVAEWTLKYLKSKSINILEWGCGVARICRHIDKYFPLNSTINACDINTKMIEWNTKNIPNVFFKTTSYMPPITYDSNIFNLILGFSVFTHIETQFQENWLHDIQRILVDDGVFLFSTHGNLHISKLTKSEQNIFNDKGAFCKSYFKKGHRLMSTYNNPSKFKEIVEKYFIILEYFDGESNYSKLGGQDLWIVKKKSN